MEKIELAQRIGDEVCEGCSSDADCEENVDECFRIQNAIIMIDKYIQEIKE